MTEIWVSPDGVACELHYVGGVPEWYADQPGQRPPARYKLRQHGHRDRVIYERTVFPVEPWSNYDAIFDVLIAEGWTPPPPEPEELAQCHHGLSLALCRDPINHWSDE